MNIKSFYNVLQRTLGIQKKNLEETQIVPLLPPDFDESSVRIFQSVREFTMTGPERINALIEAVKYVVNNKIQGDLVECGVWKGGSAMAMAHMLLELEEKEKDIYLYDTFTGMVAPTEKDVSFVGEIAQEIFQKTKVGEDASDWCYAPIDEVMRNAFGTGYPRERFHFIKGKVEDTIPRDIPEKIALLRLDTDWYESTRHEMIHLFPRLSPYGVLIIDDYGCWQGAKQAVDEYIAKNQLRIFLSRIDSTGRIAIKLP
jgi:O-methyltransferase